MKVLSSGDPGSVADFHIWHSQEETRRAWDKESAAVLRKSGDLETQTAQGFPEILGGGELGAGDPGLLVDLEMDTGKEAFVL